MTADEVRERVRDRYAQAARAVLDVQPGAAACRGEAASSCCGSSPAAADVGCFGPLYGEGEIDELPPGRPVRVCLRGGHDR